MIIYGAYGYGNTGDEAILSSLITHFKDKYDVMVFSGNSNDTKLAHSVDAVYPNPLSLIKADKILIGGGGLLSDGIVINYLIFALFAKLFKKDVEFYSVGASKMDRKLSKLLVPFVLNRINKISVRDRNSKETLEAMGIKKCINIVEDPAWTLVAIPKKEALDIFNRYLPKNRKKTIALSLKYILNRDGVGAKKEESHTLIYTMTDISKWLCENGYNILFIPFTKHNKWFENDLLFARDLSKGVDSDRFIILEDDLSPQKIKGIIGCVDLVIGMRLHSLIFAKSMNVNAIGISYAHKVETFCKNNKMTYVSTENIKESQIKEIIGKQLNIKL